MALKILKKNSGHGEKIAFHSGDALLLLELEGTKYQCLWLQKPKDEDYKKIQLIENIVSYKFLGPQKIFERMEVLFQSKKVRLENCRIFETASEISIFQNQVALNSHENLKKIQRRSSLLMIAQPFESS